MECPDENVIAQIQAGKATTRELRRFHEHLDQCSECMQLIEILSRAERAASAGSDTASPELPPHANSSEQGPGMPAGPASTWAFIIRQTSDLGAATLAIAALTHLCCAFIVVPVGKRYLASLLSTSTELAGWWILWFACAASLELCLIVGPALALCSLYGLQTHRKWAGKALSAYAISAAATLLMLPMTVCLLAVVRNRPAVRDD